MSVGRESVGAAPRPDPRRRRGEVEAERGPGPRSLGSSCRSAGLCSTFGLYGGVLCAIRARTGTLRLCSMVVASQPVRRILCRRFLRTAGGGHPSRPAVARRLQRPTRGCLRTGRPPPAWPCSRWGLPSHPGRPGCWCALTAPFHPYLCGAAPETGPAIGGLFSVALSCGSPRLGVTQHRARWSPDVPRAGAPKHPARGRPADSPPPPLSRSGGRAPMGIVATHASP